MQDLFGRGGEYDEIALQIDQPIAESPDALEALKESLGQRLGEDSQVALPGLARPADQPDAGNLPDGPDFLLLDRHLRRRVPDLQHLLDDGGRAHARDRHAAGGGDEPAPGAGHGAGGGRACSRIVGSALGLVVGYWLALGLIRLMGDLVTAEESIISVTWQGLLQSIAVGVGVTLVAALLPALQAARLSPLEALRARGRSTSRPNPVLGLAGILLMVVGWLCLFSLPLAQRSAFLWRQLRLICFFLGATLTVGMAVGWLERLTRPLAVWLYRSEGALGSANVRRAVGRTTLTVASLMVALTMIISIKSLAYSFESDLKKLDRQRPGRRPVCAGPVADARVLCQPAAQRAGRADGYPGARPDGQGRARQPAFQPGNRSPVLVRGARPGLLPPDRRHGVRCQPGRPGGELEAADPGQSDLYFQHGRRSLQPAPGGRAGLAHPAWRAALLYRGRSHRFWRAGAGDLRHV